MKNCIFYYFDEIINISDLALENIYWIKNHIKIIITLHVKSFQIIFDKEDEYIKKYDRTK